VASLVLDTALTSQKLCVTPRPSQVTSKGEAVFGLAMCRLLSILCALFLFLVQYPAYHDTHGHESFFLFLFLLSFLICFVRSFSFFYSFILSFFFFYSFFLLLFVRT
jgi:hypothetical protein